MKYPKAKVLGIAAVLGAVVAYVSIKRRYGSLSNATDAVMDDPRVQDAKHKAEDLGYRARDAFDDVEDKVTSKARDLYDSAQDSFDQARDSVREAAGDVKDAAEDMVNKTKDSAQDVAATSKDKANDLSDEAKSRAKNLP